MWTFCNSNLSYLYLILIAFYQVSAKMCKHPFFKDKNSYDRSIFISISLTYSVGVTFLFIWLLKDSLYLLKKYKGQIDVELFAGLIVMVILNFNLLVYVIVFKIINKNLWYIYLGGKTKFMGNNSKRGSPFLLKKNHRRYKLARW